MANTKVKPITARRRLELSKLPPTNVQKEGMSKDVDIRAFSVLLEGIVQTKLEDRITGASINRSIEGASILSVDIHDWDRRVLRSGLLTKGLDVQIDNLWFRMTEVNKSGDTISLIFQDREIEILRTYTKWKIAQRGQMTRAEFVNSLIREVKEFKIPIVIPELHKVQPVEKYQGDLVGYDTIVNKSKGIAEDINEMTPQDRYNHRESVITADPAMLTAKGAVATSDQIQNANIILMVGDSMGANRRVKLSAIMTAITESELRNNPGGDNAHGGGTWDSAGLFQQTGSWGSYQDRTDPETASRLYYQKAIPYETELPNVDLWQICEGVQHPREDLETQYAKWRTEAERFLAAYGDVGGSAADANSMSLQLSATGSNGPFYFYRGSIVDKRGLRIRRPENSWKCIQRLADEVDWRAFFVSGTFYFISEDDLLRQKPAATITEFSTGIQDLDFTYNRHQKSAVITLRVLAGRWQIPPGSVVVIKNCGPADGRWIVSEYSRNLIGSDVEATVILKKPRPELPEPLSSNASDINTGWTTQPGSSQLIPPTQASNTNVLSNPNIHFSNSQETNDIKFDLIDDRVLAFFLFLANRGIDFTVTALKSDHSVHTTEGKVSAHSVGKACDIGKIGNVLCANNTETSRLMDLISLYQPQLGFSQLIGPFPQKCLPINYYDGATLQQHNNHIHVGWPI